MGVFERQNQDESNFDRKTRIPAKSLVIEGSLLRRGEPIYRILWLYLEATLALGFAIFLVSKGTLEGNFIGHLLFSIPLLGIAVAHFGE